jgi:tetratricopeptide (TPR) repeat protein
MLEDPRLSAGATPGACYLKIRLAMSAGLWRNALGDLEVLMDEISPREELCLARIECLVTLGRIQEADRFLSDWRIAIGRSYLGHVLEARIAAALGKTERAFSCLRTAMELDPDKTSAVAMRVPELAPWALGAFRDQLPGAEAG